MTLPPPYQHEDNTIIQSYLLETGNELQFEARDIRKERTGVHARLDVLMNKIVLAWDNMNIERNEDRVRLANSAYKQLGELDAECWAQVVHKHALDVFCAGLWGQHIKEISIEFMEGNEAIGPPRLLLGSYVLEGGGTILFSPPGRGKSTTAMIWAVCIDAGVNNLWPVVQKRVVYVNIERSRDSMRYRLSRINRALGLAPNRPLPFINARGKSLADIIDSVRQEIHKHKAEVVMLDSISRAGIGNLLDASDVNRVVDTMNNLCPSWVALGHTPRQDETHSYGSIMFEAGEDIGVQLMTQMRGNLTGVGLRVTKANDIAKPDLYVFALEWGLRGLEAIRKAGVSDFPELTGGNGAGPLQRMIDYLLMVGKADTETITRDTGIRQEEVSRLLNASSGINKERNGHRMIWSVQELAYE